MDPDNRTYPDIVTNFVYPQKFFLRHDTPKPIELEMTNCLILANESFPCQNFCAEMYQFTRISITTLIKCRFSLEFPHRLRRQMPIERELKLFYSSQA